MDTTTTYLSELKAKTKKGKAVSEKNSLETEKYQRQRFKNEVTRNFNIQLHSVLESIEKEASKGSNHYHFILFPNYFDKEKWQNKWYEKFDHDMKELKLSTSIPFGILKNDMEVHRFDEFDFKRHLEWAVAKKIALYFLKKKLTLFYGKREFVITSDYQRSQNYKSCHFKIDCLKICW